MDMSEFSYTMNTQLVPIKISEPRDSCKMLVFHRNEEKVEHRIFRDISEYLEKGDVIVLNNTRTMHCVMRGTMTNGAIVEIKLTSRKSKYIWDCSIESLHDFSKDEVIHFAEKIPIDGIVLNKNSFGTGYLVEFKGVEDVDDWLETYAKYFVPLYLPQNIDNPEDYQTVYASELGSFQPPVAGMHFTDSLLQAIKEKGVHIAFITLHVGRLDRPDVSKGRIPIEQHKMYEEYYSVSFETANILNIAKKNGKKVIAIGTTVMRTLETIASKHNGKIVEEEGWSDLFIYPGFKNFFSDALVSNFQPPKTTNLILACTFGGCKEKVLAMYETAVQLKYQFLEFGDCILYI